MNVLRFLFQLLLILLQGLLQVFGPNLVTPYLERSLKSVLPSEEGRSIFAIVAILAIVVILIIGIIKQFGIGSSNRPASSSTSDAKHVESLEDKEDEADEADDWVFLHRPDGGNSVIRTSSGKKDLHEVLAQYQEILHREAFSKIKNNWSGNEIFVIHGEAGTGKSLLAMRFMQHIHELDALPSQHEGRSISVYYRQFEDGSLSAELNETWLARELRNQLSGDLRTRLPENCLWRNRSTSRERPAQATPLGVDHHLVFLFEAPRNALDVALKCVGDLCAARDRKVGSGLTIMLITCEYPPDMFNDNSGKSHAVNKKILLCPVIQGRLGDSVFFYHLHGGFMGLRALLLKNKLRYEWELEWCKKRMKHWLLRMKLDVNKHDDTIYCNLLPFAKETYGEGKGPLVDVTCRDYVNKNDAAKDREFLKNLAANPAAAGDPEVCEHLMGRQVIVQESSHYHFKSGIVAAYYREPCINGNGAVSTPATKLPYKRTEHKHMKLIACWCYFRAYNDSAKLDGLFTQQERQTLKNVLGDVVDSLNKQAPTEELFKTAIDRLYASNVEFNDKAASSRRKKLLEESLSRILGEMKVWGNEPRSRLLNLLPAADYVQGVFDDTAAPEIGAKLLKHLLDEETTSWLKQWCVYSLLFHQQFVALKEEAATSTADPYDEKFGCHYEALKDALDAL